MPIPRPALDIELQSRLHADGQDSAAQWTLDSIPEKRLEARKMLGSISDDALRRNGAIEFEERLVPGPTGAPNISLLILRPTGVTATLPCIFFAHGSGMVVPGNRMSISLLLDWIEEFGVVGVSVEYRVAPENPHPAPVEDCYAGLEWTSTHADQLGVDVEQIVVAGPSAGGGLAAAIALMARDRGGPTIRAQLLVYPMMDDRDTVSSLQFDGNGVWHRESNITGWKALLGTSFSSSDVSPYAAPARASNVAGLPPAYLDAGSAEVGRDEAVAYASRIWAAGGDAELHIWNGGFHGFDVFYPDTAISQAARTARSSWLRRILRTKPGPS